jgi:hypothetical protein
MSQHWISANKVRRLIVLWASTIVNKSQLADCLRISRGTARKYIVAFERSGLTGNDIERLSDAELLVALPQRSNPRTELTRSDRYNALAIQLESIHTRLKAEPLCFFEILYRRYVPRLGHNQTIGMIAHRLSRLVWKILHRGITYEERRPEVKKTSKQKRTRKMIRALRRLDYRLEPTPSQSTIPA